MTLLTITNKVLAARRVGATFVIHSVSPSTSASQPSAAVRQRGLREIVVQSTNRGEFGVEIVIEILHPPSSKLTRTLQIS